jgi:nucleoside-diphosphate-sugar epimerase
MKKSLVLGAGGFIGNHMVSKLKSEGYFVRAVDLKYPEYSETSADEFIISDLRDFSAVNKIIQIEGLFDEIYQFAADMGGAGFVFTGENDAEIMHNSATINLNVLESVHQLNQKNKSNRTKIFYSSSACMYPEHNQLDPENPICSEDSAYPANPDSEYGWEKLFSERLYLAFNRNYGLNVHIARFHNIFGPLGTWHGNKEKAPAALCRKVALAKDGDSIEVWGDGEQTRSFLYIEDCIEATNLLVNSKDFYGPVNIGSEVKVTINQLAEMAINISGKNIKINNLGGQDFIDKFGFACPTGVRGRNSDNKFYREKIGWEVSLPLKEGMIKTFNWINEQVNKK